MELERAEKIANEVVKRLSPYCSRIEVAGSVRRKKPTARDIDIVLIPSDLWNLTHEIAGLGPARLMGSKLKRVLYNGVQIDLYFADEETWAMILLIRTGSKFSNIELANRAKSLGMKLKADGSGIIGKDGKLISVNSEEEVFHILGLSYKHPEERG